MHTEGNKCHAISRLSMVLDKVIITEVHGFRLVFVLHLPVVLSHERRLFRVSFLVEPL